MMYAGRCLALVLAIGGLAVPLSAQETAPSREPLVLDLDGCIAYALENSYDLARQRITLANSQLGITIARHKYAPGISGSASHRDSTTPGSLKVRQVLPTDLEISASASAADLGDSDARSDPGYSIGLSKRILGGGSYHESMLEIDNSLIDAAIAANRLSEQERDMVRRVMRQYYDLQRARQTLVIRQRRVEIAQANLEHAIAREDPLDIANAQLNVPTSEAALLRSEREINTALDELKRLIGAPLDAPVEITGEVVFESREVDVESDIKRSEVSHETVLNKRLEIRKTENELPISRSRVLPAVDLGFTADRGGGTAKEDGWSYETRVSASWNLFAGAERAKLRQLRNQLADADLSLEMLLRERQTSLTNLARRLEEALRQVDIGRQGVEVAERRAALYNDRWENGAIDILEYIRSQNDLEQSRVDLVDLEITYLETLADYLHAVGDPLR